tara:strand:+ start:840 stop:1469 length:630 start_codon:yes stop_codon:yes gene_type:complete
MNKAKLKQIIKEELSKVMNEMAIDEMAFSMSDLESASAEVETSDAAGRAKETGEHLHNLLRNFQIQMDNAGGQATVDARVAQQYPPGLFRPYHKNLAIIYNVLGKLGQKMFDKRTTGHDWGPLPWKLRDMTINIRNWNDDPSLRKRQDSVTKQQLNNALHSVKDIIALARKTADQPAFGFDEPYLSAENADALEELWATAKDELAASSR